MASFGNSQNVYVDGSNSYSNILSSILNVVNSNNQIVSSNLNLINNEIQNNENLDSNQQSDINILKNYFNNGLLKLGNLTPSSITSFNSPFLLLSSTTPNESFWAFFKNIRIGLIDRLAVHNSVLESVRFASLINVESASACAIRYLRANLIESFTTPTVRSL